MTFASHWRARLVRSTSSAASLVTTLAGLLVLAGAIAAGSARLYDSTAMKVPGATRAQVAGVYVLEYGLIGLTTGTIARPAGTAATGAVAERVLAIPFDFDLGAALMTVVAGGTLAAFGLGLFAARSALTSRPAQQLRCP